MSEYFYTFETCKNHKYSLKSKVMKKTVYYTKSWISNNDIFWPNRIVISQKTWKQLTQLHQPRLMPGSKHN